MSDDHFSYLKEAVEQARKSKSEDGRTHPKVGVVIVSEKGEITRAFRGELGAGDHAEYTALEKKLVDETIAGSTVYTTLEPCTTRNHPKVPCAQRLIERRVKKVVVGMLDPNPNILGQGILQLREAGIEVELFPHELMLQLEEINRDFRREHPLPEPVTEALLEQLRKKSLDEWYVLINSLYWNRNFPRQANAIFTHLVEVVGSLSVLVSRKQVLDSSSTGPYMAKAIAWWLALCGQVGVSSVSRMLWAKFPNACPYCRVLPHDNDECLKNKKLSRGPDWTELKSKGAAAIGAMPKSVSQWQQMFARIYPPTATEDYPTTFAKLTEEMGELAEALRVFSAEPGYFLSEAADVFAWLMKLNNLVERATVKEERGLKLEESLADSYPARCRDCNASICACPPILPSTIGRIAHEVPENFVSYNELGSFLTADKRSEKFGRI